MTDEGDNTGRRAFIYLLLGYIVTAITTAYIVIGGFGSFAGYGPSATQNSVSFFFTMLGFFILVYSQIRYLNETGRLRWLERRVAGTRLKPILAFLSGFILVLVYINIVLHNYEFYQADDPELGGIVILTLTLFLIGGGILLFNVIVTLTGPVYIALFYYFAFFKKGDRVIEIAQDTSPAAELGWVGIVTRGFTFVVMLYILTYVLVIFSLSILPGFIGILHAG